MPDIETLRENDEALNKMYAGDTKDGQALSPEDEQAFKDLIAEQRAHYQETLYAKKSDEGEVAPAIAPSIGNAALHNPSASEDSAVYFGNSKNDDWRMPK